jgi:diguanylate cyclase (GGDEF)-like protein
VDGGAFVRSEIEHGMDIVTLELVRTALLALVVGILIAAGRLRVDASSRGWWLAFWGFLVLMTVSAFESAADFPFLQNMLGAWTNSASNGLMLLIGFIVGFVLIGIEMVRAISRAATDQRTRQLHAALTRVKTQVSSGQALLRGVLRGSLSGVVVVRAVRDEVGTVVDLVCELMNGAAAQILGRTGDDLLGQPLLRFVPTIATEGLFRECVSVIESGLPFNEERRYAFSGSAEWLHTVVTKLGDGCAITFTNISARKQAEEQLRQAALHDALTGLPNRAMFIQRLEQALLWAQRNRSYAFTVLFFDFDRFKQVNDSLGHEAGDELLRSIARRLCTQLEFDETDWKRQSNHLPARLGGDEFVVLLDGIGDKNEALLVVQRLEATLGTPHMIAGQEIISSASIGVVACDGTYESADAIVRDADTAMYQAKRAGRSCHVVFDKHMRGQDVERERAA